MESIVNAGTAPYITLGVVGIQGAAGIGVQGGPGRPAIFAGAKPGLAGDVHNPNGKIFKKGTISIIVAMGIQSPIDMEIGRMASGTGAIPKEHIAKQPQATVGPGIFILPFLFSLSCFYNKNKN
jgi:hypothetical protein